MPTLEPSTESASTPQDYTESFLKMLEEVNQWIWEGFTTSRSKKESIRKNQFQKEVERLSQAPCLTNLELFFQNDFKTYTAFETFYSNFRKQFNLPVFIDIELQAVYIIFTLKCYKQLPSLINDEEKLVALLAPKFKNNSTATESSTSTKSSIRPEILDLLDDERLFELISNVHRFRYLIENIQPLELIQLKKILSVLEKRPNEWVTNGNLTEETDDFISIFKHESLNEEAQVLLWELIKTTKFEWILTSEDYLNFIKIPILANDEIKQLDFVFRMASQFEEWMSRSQDLQNLFKPIKLSGQCYFSLWVRIAAEFYGKPDLQKFENIITCKNIRQRHRNAFQKDTINMALCCKLDDLDTWIFLLNSNQLPIEDRIRLYDSFKDKAPSLKPRREFDLPSDDEESGSDIDGVEDEEITPHNEAFPNTAKEMALFLEHEEDEEDETIPTTPTSEPILLSPLNELNTQTPLVMSRPEVSTEIKITNAEEFKNYWNSEQGKSSKMEDLLGEKRLRFTSWITYIRQVVDLLNEWALMVYLPIAEDIKQMIIKKSTDIIIEHNCSADLLSLLVCKSLSNTERLNILLEDLPTGSSDSEKTLAEHLLKDVQDIVTLFTQFQFDSSKEDDVALETLLTELITDYLNQNENIEDLKTLLECSAISTRIQNKILSNLSDNYLTKILVTHGEALTALLNAEDLDLDRLIENPEFTVSLTRLEKKLANKSAIKEIETCDDLTKALKQLRSLYRMQLLNAIEDSSLCFSFFSQKKSSSLELKIKAIDIFLSELSSTEMSSTEKTNPLVVEKRNSGRISQLVNRWIEIGQPNTTQPQSDENDGMSPR